MTLRIISYGGGVQSSALVVLASQGRLDEVMGGPIDAAVFVNVGDDAEHPDTLGYVRTVMTPWATERGVTVEEIRPTWRRGARAGQPKDLHTELMRPDLRDIPIPIRMPEGMPGMRQCTVRFKIRVISRWLREHGASPDTPAVRAVGISTDEFHRANNANTEPNQSVAYPLLDLGLDRQACMSVIRDAGLPVPPKSSCYFCPFHKPAHWSEMRRDRPDLFDQAAELEAHLIVQRINLGRDPAYLTRFGKPLRDAIPEAQDRLFVSDDWSMDNDGECDDEVCFT
jgi:hypothetical protein